LHPAARAQAARASYAKGVVPREDWEDERERRAPCKMRATLDVMAGKVAAGAQ